MAAAGILRRLVRLVRSRPAVLTALVLALSWPIPTAGQDEDTPMKAPAGSYRGRVGQPIPDAVVVILWQRFDDQVEGVRRLVSAQETFTDSKGEFVHDVHAVEAKLPARTLAPRMLMFRPGYTPVPDQPQVRSPGIPAARYAGPGATATMTAIADYEDRSEAFNIFIAMLSAAQLFPGTQLPDTAELLRFELQSLGARPPQPVDPRGGR